MVVTEVLVLVILVLLGVIFHIVIIIINYFH